uniref:Putative HAD-superfamily hydrolase, subfamily IA n=1 Tax=Magnetococcus massalia (strain MO-1) TaxID=451514 RepID=A0A1S7LIP1_MAGMO|nr:putative HAD-superfamily hydrolase, subfamily IA [Candidatus Magnetococcus massalia]
MTSRYELVIFDCDGTLVDSLDGIARVLNIALEDAGLPAGLSHWQVGSIVGLSLDEAALALLPDQSKETRDKVVNSYRAHYKMLADEKQLDSPLFPGVRETLEQLKKDGVTVAMATGKSMRGVERVIREHHLEGIFDAIKTADCAPSKPNPGMINQILRETSMPPEMALMVGDTEFDIFMGRAAGIHTCAVPFGCHPRDRLEKSRPTHWAETIPDVLKLSPDAI